MLILRRADVETVLAGREKEIVDLVADTYRLHDAGQSAVPHSVFLRFPEEAHSRDRIIGLPAYAGGPAPAAGIKWIASFPGNVARGRERASASIVLNSLEDGRPAAVVEGAVVSARRTAASAALAARELTIEAPPSAVGLIGCGVINHEILRFLTVTLPGLTEAACFDTNPQRAAAFADRCAAEFPALRVTTAATAFELVGRHRLVSLATTAAEPHMDLTASPPDTTVLHVSLRDLTVPTILAATNVVDDADHVCRERTSLHLAEQSTGGRDFVTASLGALLRGSATVTRDPYRPVVFSPFGLGVLDIALAEFVRRTAAAASLGVRVDDFLP